MRTTPFYIIRNGVEAEEAWLTAHGFDGLACMIEECGCFIGDLYPCGERGEKHVCVAGYANSEGTGVYRTKSQPSEPPR